MGGRGKGEWVLPVMGTFMTKKGSVSFAVISNKTCYLNSVADCHATARMKTSRDT